MEKDTSINIRKRDRSSSPFLYDLIHSMTPGEKKYFKQSAKSDTSAKNYLTIFETLEKQESFDDEAAYELLKTKIKGCNNYRTTKQFLLKMILKWMRSYPDAEKNDLKEIKNSIEDIRFLMKKGFYKQVKKDLEKIKTLAKNSEAYIGFEIISLDYMLLATIGTTKDLPEKMVQLRELVGVTDEKVLSYFKHLDEITVENAEKASVKNKTFLEARLLEIEEYFGEKGERLKRMRSEKAEIKALLANLDS